MTENLLVDKNDNIWIGSATGLFLYSTTNGTYKKFKEMDGLATENWSKDFSIGYISDKKIKAKTSNQFSVFDPEILLQESKVPKPYVNRVEILDSTIFLSQDDPYELYLEPDEDYFTIHYSAKEYNNGRNLLFDYMIESYDKDWITGGLSHKVSYNHLPPGTYDFLVRAYTAEGKASVVSDKFVIKVRAHWYESLYFKLALLLLTGIILYLFYKMKTNSLRRELALRSQFNEELSQVKLEALRSQMNPHFLFNCLNSIDNFILSNDAQNASEYLGKFSKLIRNILDYSKTNLITLKEEIESTELYIKMEQMRFTDKFDYKISIDPSINQNLKSIPPLILQPYVENSIWHGLLHKKVKGTIRISISQDSNYYNIKIDDDGIGRQKAQSIKTKTATKRKSHGMKITEDRIRLVHQLNCQGGTVDIIDKVDINGSPMGTTVVIKLAIPEITSSR